MARILIVLFLVCCCSKPLLALEPVWEDLSQGITEVKAVLFSSKEDRMFIGTDKGLFFLDNKDRTWHKSLALRTNKINSLGLTDEQDTLIYACTDNGLYVSADNGIRWKRVFSGKNYKERSCLSVLAEGNRIFLGTKSGLFMSEDKGRTWLKNQGRPGNVRIITINSHKIKKELIYLASDDGVYKSINFGKSWERIFVSYPEKEDTGSDEDGPENPDEEKATNLRYLAIDQNNPDILLIATNRGVLRSSMAGGSWESLPVQGLLSRDIQHLIITGQGRIYAASSSGIFFFDNDLWREVSFRLTANKIATLSMDSSFRIYACTEKGLFRMVLSEVVPELATNIIEEYSKGEPSIDEVQRAAIKYAELDKQKIDQWRKRAAQKAILPSLNVGIDRNSTDLWHWEGGSTTKVDDDTLRKGRDSVDWSVSLSWDLGDLVWNDDQTSIDVRSRLMVELRNDVLDEVIKLYYERIRLKMEMETLQIEDRRRRLEKELRIRELTASLDSLTGGYFSEYINGKRA